MPYKALKVYIYVLCIAEACWGGPASYNYGEVIFSRSPLGGTRYFPVSTIAFFQCYEGYVLSGARLAHCAYDFGRYAWFIHGRHPGCRPSEGR